MSYLSDALAQYYAREGRRVVFRNGQSLNELALAMWENLGFRQVDASVLSRVLKGERLFTSQQLTVFCNVLGLTKKETQQLATSLQQDYDARLRLNIGTTHISADLASEIIKSLTGDAFDLFYRGEHDLLETKHDLIEQLTQVYIPASRGQKDEAVGVALGLSLYLKGRVMANHELSSHIVARTRPIFNTLMQMSRRYKSESLNGYAHVLMSNAYYIAGGYSTAVHKQRHYKASFKLAEKAVSSLAETDHERLSALRSMAASAGYVYDQATLRRLAEVVKDIIPKQPKENYINMLHVCSTLGKGMATIKGTNPFAVQELAKTHFKRDLADAGIYEVSALKEEVDTLLLLESNRNDYIKQQLKKGLQMASEHNYPRHVKHFNKLLKAV